MSQGSGKFQGIKIRASFGSSHNLVKLDALINLLTGNRAPLPDPALLVPTGSSDFSLSYHPEYNTFPIVTSPVPNCKS